MSLTAYSRAILSGSGVSDRVSDSYIQSTICKIKLMCDIIQQCNARRLDSQLACRVMKLGIGGFSKDQLKGKQLLPTFQSDALVVFRALAPPLGHVHPHSTVHPLSSAICAL